MSSESTPTLPDPDRPLCQANVGRPPELPRKPHTGSPRRKPTFHQFLAGGRPSCCRTGRPISKICYRSEFRRAPERTRAHRRRPVDSPGRCARRLLEAIISSDALRQARQVPASHSRRVRNDRPQRESKFASRTSPRPQTTSRCRGPQQRLPAHTSSYWRLGTSWNLGGYGWVEAT